MNMNSIIDMPYNLIKAAQEMILGKVDRTRLTSRILPQHQYGKPLLKPENYNDLVLAYREWVYIAASRNATTAATVPLRLYVAKKTASSKLLRPSMPISKTTKERLHNKAGLQHIVCKAAEIEEITEHPFMQLMKNINPHMNRFMLWELTHLHQELTGNAYWWIAKNSAGIPAELWVIPPQHMWVVPSKDKFIKGFLYSRTGYGSYSDSAERIAFDVDEIIHFKYANPYHSFYGLSPLAAITDSYNISQNMNVYEKAIFKNMGRPDGVLETDQENLDEDTYKKIHEEWEENYGGTSNTGKIAILEAGTKYKPMNFKPRELGFLKGREYTRDIIRNAYGQTEAMFKASSLAAARVADRAYRRDTIEPRLTRIEEKLNEQFMPVYGDMTLFVAYDDPVEENKEESRSQQKHLLEFGLSDINAERMKMGDEPYAMPEADVPMIGAGRMAINAPRPMSAVPPPEKTIDEIAETIAEKMLEG